MQYWLVKSEPSVYSWVQLVKDKETSWTGVRNYAARNNLRSMRKGDQVFFYHSNEGLAIVAIAVVAREAYQDPTTPDTNWVTVDIRPVKKLKRPVTLAEIRATEALADMQLVKLGRLSVTAVSAAEFATIVAMAGS